MSTAIQIAAVIFILATVLFTMPGNQMSKHTNKGALGISHRAGNARTLNTLLRQSLRTHSPCERVSSVLLLGINAASRKSTKIEHLERETHPYPYPIPHIPFPISSKYYIPSHLVGARIIFPYLACGHFKTNNANYLLACKQIKRKQEPDVNAPPTKKCE